MINMDTDSELQTHRGATRLRRAWNEYRLLFYSALIGIVGGLGAQLFVWILNLAQRLLLIGIAGYQPPEPGSLNPEPIVGPWGLWLIPVATTLGGLLSGILVYTFAPEAEGHGTDAAVEAFHFKGGKDRPIVPLIKVLSSAITIGSGGAAGREGPTAQISVGVGSMLADLMRLPDEERRILVLAGMAAGLAAIFRSPLGMAIFSVEILYSGMAFETEALIYTVIASVVAYAVNGLFVGWSPIFLFPQSIHFTQPIALVGYATLGIVAGVIGAIAVIIRGTSVVAAGCVLPLSADHAPFNLKGLGMRHRAGVGLSQVSDAVVFIVSEETGTISMATEGHLFQMNIEDSPEAIERLPRNSPALDDVISLD